VSKCIYTVIITLGIVREKNNVWYQ